jgi:hypothetical protein
MKLRLTRKYVDRPIKRRLNNTFIKTGVEHLAIEVNKAKSLHSVAENHSFLSPKVLEYSEEDGSITYGFMDGLRSIREAYLEFMTNKNPLDSVLELLAECGTVLADLHTHLRLENTVDWSPPHLFTSAYSAFTGDLLKDTLDSVPWSVAHCDYGFSNIHYLTNSKGDKTLVVLDASYNGFVTNRSNLNAPIYVDLGNLLACVEGLVPVKNYFRMHWSRLGTVRDAIVIGYQDRSGYEIDRTVLGGMVYATAKCYLRSVYKRPFSDCALRILFSGLKSG